MIPYGRQNISQKDIEAVIDVLNSDFLTQGPTTVSFESELSKITKAKHSVTVSSATAALHIACIALDLGPGDLLWTTPITFVASANCGRYCGAEVDFVDIDPDTFNMCPDALAEKLKKAEKVGKLPKILVAVHMCGQPPAMDRITRLARAYNIKVIEDASHAIGASYFGKPVGSGAYADVTVFSFHPVKIVTTGEGGAALTNDSSLAMKMRRLRSHGITRDERQMTCEPDGAWYYQQLELGYNYRMTDIQAALGISQLSRLKEFVEKRTQIADRYDTLLYDLQIDLPIRLKHATSSWHLYVIRLCEKSRHSDIFDFLRSNGIGVNLHYIPVHLQPYYQQLGFCSGDYPIAEDYYARAISLPIYPDLKESDQKKVVNVLQTALG